MILVYCLFQANTSFVTFTCFTRPGSAVRRVLNADLGVASLIPARSHTFMEIDHEIISKVIFSCPLIHSRIVSYNRKYVHELLVNRVLKLSQENVWLGGLSVPHDHSF